MSYIKVRFKNAVKILMGNKKFLAGLIILIFIAFIGYSAYIFQIPFPKFGSAPPFRKPSEQFLLGTDGLGRDLFAVLLYSIQTSLYIGFTAGIIGTAIGVLVGFLGGYKGGLVDHILRSVTDIFLVIPLWPLLILISASVRSLSIPVMASLLAAFSWQGSARAIRSQVMSLKEREFVNIARLSGLGTLEILFKEILPNMIPYVASGFVMSVTGAVLTEAALEIIGLGPPGATSIGLMLYWSQQYAATVKGWWWWLVPPILILILIFIALFLILLGLDEISNPRLRKA